MKYVDTIFLKNAIIWLWKKLNRSPKPSKTAFYQLSTTVISSSQTAFLIKWMKIGSNLERGYTLRLLWMALFLEDNWIQTTFLKKYAQVLKKYQEVVINGCKNAVEYTPRSISKASTPQPFSSSSPCLSFAISSYSTFIEDVWIRNFKLIWK